MKKFDIEAAKAGAPVCTRGGKPVRILCFDAKGSSPIVGLITNDDCEITARWNHNGCYYASDRDCCDDLMMVDIDSDSDSCVSDEFLEKLAQKIVEKMPQFPWWVQTPTPNNPLGDCVMYGTGIAPYDYTINPTISTSSAKINDEENVL